MQDLSSVLSNSDIPGLFNEKDYEDMLAVCKQPEAGVSSNNTSSNKTMAIPTSTNTNT